MPSEMPSERQAEAHPTITPCHSFPHPYIVGWASAHQNTKIPMPSETSSFPRKRESGRLGCRVGFSPPIHPHQPKAPNTPSLKIIQ
ncbi:hypothetical protein [Neisseria lactamica]|uniref:hypothetical protein n=2 Tax=Neisseria TaxID=482 RepID=UPI00129050F3|nr:hypothetical protein [Neisseria lactamica]